MVTLAQTQNLNEFELHLRAVLGLPIPMIEQLRAGASAAILSPIETDGQPRFKGQEEALAEPRTDLRIFRKPKAWPHRRLGVALAYDNVDCDIDTLRDKAKAAAAKIQVY